MPGHSSAKMPPGANMRQSDRQYTDQRVESRFAIDEHATVTLVENRSTFSGRILNLSLHGCSIEAPQKLPGGGRVRVEVTFLINGIPFRMGGAVRWCDEDAMGIQFVRVSPMRQQEWVMVIKELGAHAARESTQKALPARDMELVQIVEDNLAKVTRRAGPLLACRVGCTQCCHGAFAINSLDALRLRSGMEKLRTFAPEKAEAIEARARAWIAEHGAEFPGDTATGLIGTSEEEQARFEEFASDAACPALDPVTGRCDVYAWRPMTCRVFGPPVRAAGNDGEEGLGHCELCFVGATEEQVSACEMPVPHELEAELLAEIGAGGETVVAFAIIT
jgi:Fe-S-cluster containining protein